MLTRSAGSPVRYNRAQWFAALLVAAVLSGYFNIVRASLRLGDAWSAGAGLLGINAITWIALFAILHLALDSKAAEAPRRLDLAILGLGAVSLFMPSGWEARAFVFVGALYLFLTSARGEIGRKIAIIALALSVPLIWARLAIYLFGPELLPFDAALVGLVTGLPVNGNVVDFPTAVGVADGRQMVILSGCSSFTNVSMSIVVMAIVSQLLDLPINRRLILVGACAAVAAMSVNIARLALIALKPEHYEFLHVGLGASLFGYASLIAIGAVAIAGTYRARRTERRCVPVPKAYLAVIALGAAAVAVRSAQPGFRREANVGAIGRELAAAAAAAGYRTRIGKGGALTIEVRAQHGPCQRHLFAFNPDGSEVAKIQGRFPGQPMIFHWGAQRSDRFPRPWPLLATYAKGYVRTFGINLPIPPLVAEVAGSACASAPAIRFDRLRYPLE